MKKVLTIGFGDFDLSCQDCLIENWGLGRSGVVPNPAPPLYEHDIIIINTESFSHFIFGEKGIFSEYKDELYQLRNINKKFDFKDVIDWEDRRNELIVASNAGAKIIWCISKPHEQNFFSYRVTNDGYLDKRLSGAVSRAGIVEKDSHNITRLDGYFHRFFRRLEENGWRLALRHGFEGCKPIAWSREKYVLAGRIEWHANGWLVTPPRNKESALSLILDALELPESKTLKSRYHGIFLCYSHADKSFVHRLRDALQQRGVSSVWVDDGEIKIGDSIIGKIQEAIEKNAYFGIVLSPDSVKSNWVRAELAMAYARESEEGRVVILPMMYRRCDIPGILKYKFYADFRDKAKFDSEIEAIVSRSKI